MDAILADEAIVPKDQLRALYQRSDGPSWRRLGAQFGLYLLTAAGLVLVDDSMGIAVLLLAHGIVHFGFFGMIHESAHRTAFATPWLNDLAGWIAALPQPMTPALMRAFHFAHHRHTHQLDGDPELGGFDFMAHWPRGLMALGTLTGLPILMARVGWTLFAALVPRTFDSAWRTVLPFVSEDRRRRIVWEARLLTLIHAGLILTAVFVEPGLGWTYAGMLIGHMFLSWYTTCEHRGLATEGSILARTRTLKVPGVVRWLVWNMSYHAEHHGWPAVPWHELPRLHELVKPQLVNHVRPRELYFG